MIVIVQQALSILTLATADALAQQQVPICSIPEAMVVTFWEKTC
jgi:hypothetical protein